MKHPISWFVERTGTRIFRDAVSCKCETCEEGTKEGLVVRDTQHADHLYNIQLDLDIDYRDKI